MYSTSSQTYKKFAFQYGLKSILLVLEYFVDTEEYEECQKIIDCINGLEKFLNTTLHKTLNEDLEKEIKEVYERFGLTGIHHDENSKEYSNILIKIIKRDF